MAKYSVRGMSRKEIRDYANKIRKIFKIDFLNFIDMPKLLDLISIAFVKLNLNFNYEIREENDQIFEDYEEAFTCMKTGTIYFKKSVIENACRHKYNRGAFTIAHELGHFFLHYFQVDVKLSRISEDESVPIYKDPEWQANTFASELLMPFEQCINLDEQMIRKKYHVSRQAAKTRKNMINKEIQNENKKS